ncbi:MAG: hypothetical protein V2I57_14345, partial [Xanthomonadales bacterium]|nr:hypothetical protein [Xanthomonadales bacterium]
GDRFEAGAPLGIVHAASDEDADRVAQALLDALTFNEDMTGEGAIPEQVIDRLTPASREHEKVRDPARDPG